MLKVDYPAIKRDYVVELCKAAVGRTLLTHAILQVPCYSIMWRRVATRALRLSALPAAFAAHHACCDSAPPSDRVRKVAASIDHTLLKPDAMPRDVQRLCEEAALHRFASVCVSPVYVGLARAVLNELGCPEIPVCAVVGFPLGASTSAVKAFEAEAAIAEGADEIDMVLPIGVLKVRLGSALHYNQAAWSGLRHRAVSCTTT